MTINVVPSTKPTDRFNRSAGGLDKKRMLSAKKASAPMTLNYFGNRHIVHLPEHGEDPDVVFSVLLAFLRPFHRKSVNE